VIYALLGVLVIGVSLGLLGSGGSILTVPILVYLLQHEGKAAIAESLAIVGVIALVSAARAWLRGLLDGRSAVLLGVPGMAGTFLGTYLAHWVPGAVQLLLLAGVMLATATMMVAQRSPRPRAEPGATVLVAAQGVGIGVVTGLVGVGGGFLIVPALVLLLGLPMARAVPTSLAVIAMNSAIGFAKYQSVLGGQGLAADWGIVAVSSTAGIAGSLAGGSIGAQMNPAVLPRGFAAFLLVMAVYIVYQETGRLLQRGGEADEGPAVGLAYRFSESIGNAERACGLSVSDQAVRR
jgi:uncharacterized protein